MPASNIETVIVDGGALTIIGTIDELTDYETELLHVWLAQPGNPGQAGAGLAIDCLSGRSTVFKGERFTLTVPAGSPGVVGTFVPGPATASAIAVLVPKGSNPKGLSQEVLEWSRIVMLSGPAPVSFDKPQGGQGPST